MSHVYEIRRGLDQSSIEGKVLLAVDGSKLARSWHGLRLVRPTFRLIKEELLDLDYAVISASSQDQLHSTLNWAHQEQHNIPDIAILTSMPNFSINQAYTLLKKQKFKQTPSPIPTLLLVNSTEANFCFDAIDNERDEFIRIPTPRGLQSIITTTGMVFDKIRKHSYMEYMESMQAGPRGKGILAVVDSNLSAWESLVEYAGKRGIRLDLTQNLPNAIGLLDNREYSCLIVDIDRYTVGSKIGPIHILEAAQSKNIAARTRNEQPLNVLATGMFSNIHSVLRSLQAYCLDTGAIISYNGDYVTRIQREIDLLSQDESTAFTDTHFETAAMRRRPDGFTSLSSLDDLFQFSEGITPSEAISTLWYANSAFKPDDQQLIELVGRMSFSLIRVAREDPGYFQSAIDLFEDVVFPLNQRLKKKLFDLYEQVIYNPPQDEPSLTLLSKEWIRRYHQDLVHSHSGVSEGPGKSKTVKITTPTNAVFIKHDTRLHVETYRDLWNFLYRINRIHSQSDMEGYTTKLSNLRIASTSDKEDADNFILEVEDPDTVRILDAEFGLKRTSWGKIQSTQNVITTSGAILTGNCPFYLGEYIEDPVSFWLERMDERIIEPTKQFLGVYKKKVAKKHWNALIHYAEQFYERMLKCPTIPYTDHWLGSMARDPGKDYRFDLSSFRQGLPGVIEWATTIHTGDYFIDPKDPKKLNPFVFEKLNEFLTLYNQTVRTAFNPLVNRFLADPFDFINTEISKDLGELEDTLKDSSAELGTSDETSSLNLFDRTKHCLKALKYFNSYPSVDSFIKIQREVVQQKSSGKDVSMVLNDMSSDYLSKGLVQEAQYLRQLYLFASNLKPKPLFEDYGTDGWNQQLENLREPALIAGGKRTLLMAGTLAEYCRQGREHDPEKHHIRRLQLVGSWDSSRAFTLECGEYLHLKNGESKRLHEKAALARYAVSKAFKAGMGLN
tara:strand:+ start:2282 stop:5140 length:2859 start_codon:yes stop_codon:yes gene_type:complete